MKNPGGEKKQKKTVLTEKGSIKFSHPQNKCSVENNQIEKSKIHYKKDVFKVKNYKKKKKEKQFFTLKKERGKLSGKIPIKCIRGDR